MSFPLAEKSMYTSGFSARVANPRRTLVVILAEDAANFEKASMIKTNTRVKVVGNKTTLKPTLHTST